MSQLNHHTLDRREEEEDTKEVSFLPVYRYPGKRNNILRGMYSAVVELIHNSYGKETTISLEKTNGHSHLEGRGDTQHRQGGVRTVAEHDRLVEESEKNRSKNLEHRKKKGK